MNEDAEEEFVSRTTAFIRQSENWLESAINAVGWTTKDLAELIEVIKPEYVCCPVNTEHRMPASSLELHLSKCEKTNASYPNVSSLELSTSLQGTSAVCKLEFDRDVVRESETVGTTASSSQTLAELLKVERDAKRRRAAHRGKRVHSNKKTYNEVMREVIANQMLTLSDDVEKDEGCKTDVGRNNQEPVAPNFTYLGMGTPYYRGNPYKRWLTIEQEEEETMAKMRKQSSKREEDRNERYSRHANDRRSSRRDYRNDRDRYHTSSNRDRDYRREESRYGESRKENRDRVEDDRKSRREKTRRDRREFRATDTKDEKRVDEPNYKKHRESRSDEYREDPDLGVHDKIVFPSHDDPRRDRRDYRASYTEDQKRIDEHSYEKHRESWPNERPENPDLAMRDRMVFSSRDDPRSDRREYRVSDGKDLKRVEKHSSRKRSESRYDDGQENSDRDLDAELVTKREQSSRSRESSDDEKKQKKKKKKKKHKHKKKHKKASSSD